MISAAALLPIVLPAVAQAEVPTRSSNDALERELRNLLDRQAEQRSRGDLEGFCSHYAEDAIFVSPSGRTDGRKAVYERYKKKYVDGKGMGALSLEVLHIVADDAAASIAMLWRLSFENKAPARGYSVIGLRRESATWKIVHDASM